jgi:hypothetical protein
MDARLPGRRPVGTLLLSLVALIAVAWSAPSAARRVVIDFGSGNDPSLDHGDSWVFDSTNCVAGSTLPASCGITFGTNNVVEVKMGFSVRVGEGASQIDTDSVFISKFGYVSFGLGLNDPFAAVSGSTATEKLDSMQGIVSPIGNRPFITPYYSDLSDLPDRLPEEFNLQDPVTFIPEGASYYRSNSDPTAPYTAGGLVPAFAATWVHQPHENQTDDIKTQVVIYKFGNSGDFDFRIRYGLLGTEAYSTTNTDLPGVAGFSLKTGDPPGPASDAGVLTEPLSASEDPVVDYFFCVRGGHLASCDTVADGDADGVPDSTDNCPTVANAGQQDNDADGQGDACDSDDDNDGVADTSDNCALIANANQLNTDGDALGNACDPDDDNDGVPDAADNCPLTANTNQADADHDGVGDVCDTTPTPQRCDVDTDGDIDYFDLDRILRALGRPASGPTDPRDFNGDLRIRFDDLVNCTKQCTRKLCLAR